MHKEFKNLIQFILLLCLVLDLSACSTFQRRPASEEPPEINYPQIFNKVRETLSRRAPPAADAKLLKNTPETQIVEVLQNDSTKITLDRDQLLKDVNQESASRPNPIKHLRLVPPQGGPGYSNLKFVASHPYYLDETLIPASDLVTFWKDFLRQAEKEIILNVFDFDLEDVAAVLIHKAQSGLHVRVGIDRNTIKHRPEVKKVADLLVRGGVQLTEVNSVSLNHQKVTAIDWSSPEKAKVLFSSGNLTQSCLGPEGDLKNMKQRPLPPESIPNANHMISMDSWLLANLVHHELTKTLDPQFAYRGSLYPMSGSYQVTGPGVPAETFEAYPENSLIVAFSPGGAYRNINQNIIAHFIKHSEGPTRLVQFAYSSKEVSQALLEKAVKEYSKTGKFDFLSVGDTPFAMQSWSQFLAMTGLKQKLNGDKKFYEEDPENLWVQKLSESELEDLRKKVLIAPAVYGNNKVKIDKKYRDVSAKIHHKVLVTGPYAIVGTSFNFSQGAEINNEQILVFKDPFLVKAATGMAKWLAEKSPRSVYEEAERRNKFGAPKNEASTDLPAAP